MRIFHMRVDSADIYVILDGDEASSGMVDEANDFSYFEYSEHPATFVHDWFKRQGQGSLEEIVERPAPLSHPQLV